MADVKFSLEISGLDKLFLKLSAIVPAVKQAAKTELYQIAEEIMDDSKRIVPVDTGALMSTGHVDLPVDTEKGIEISLGYGGPAAPYALAVHENLDPRVHWQRPGSGPKYLETPWNAKKTEISPRIRKAMLDALVNP